MKSLIVFLTILISSTVFASHNHKDMNMKNMKTTSMNKKSANFLAPYFILHAKLIKDQLPTKKEIKALESSLHKEIKATKDNNSQKELKKAEKFVEAMKGNDIKKLRANFFELSKVLIPFSKKHQLTGVQAYYCPMAKKSWLQNQSDITYNPYMPKQMLHCGSKI